MRRPARCRRAARAAVCALHALERRVLLSVNVTSYHYDLSETGANTSETTLTPDNVNTTTFGKVASLPVDGQIYAQPLVMTGVSVPGQGVEDLVFVATEHDSVYAFNAQGGSTAPVWKTSLLQSGETTIPYTDTGTNDITPEIGITSTPVINAATDTIYVEANFKESNGTYQQRLYALDIATGANVVSPAIIAGSVSGTGVGSSGGTLTFSSLLENQRPALTLANGQVYLAFASHGDNGNYHGWVAAYNPTTLAQDYLWCDSPNASQGGIWMSGGGLAVDSSGDLYLTTGNGTFDANTGGSDYGMAFVKLSPTLQVLDYFSPYNESSLSSSDLDYGCGNAILLPTQTGSAPNEALTLGKWGGVYLNNTDTGAMGEINNPPNGPNKDLGETNTGGHQHNTFAYWNGYAYIGPDAKALQAYPVANGTLAKTPSSISAHVFGSTSVTDGQGAGVSVSSNGTAAGIVWALDNTGFNSRPAVLYAYNANNLGQVLWSSNQAAGGRDACGNAVKFTTPVVANGFVYVGGAGTLTLYSNIPPAPPPPPPPPPPPGGIGGFTSFTLNGANGAGIDGSSTKDNNPADAPSVSADNTTLTLTTAAGNEASSAFYNSPLYFQNFVARFTYQESGGTPADGITFTIQDDVRGPNALAGGGGDLGYATDASHPATAISPSFAVELNVYKVSSTSIATNGANTVSTATANTGTVNLASGDPVNVTLAYNSSGQTLVETLADSVTGATCSTTYSNVNLSSVFGSRTAFVGFTGGTGGNVALQTVSNFTYVAAPAPQVNLTSAFTDYGISVDGQPTISVGYDGGGSALSETFFGPAQAIAADAPSQTFFFAPTGQPNTITSSGQTIPLPQGNYADIFLIGSAVNGNQANQSVSVNYTDGTSATFSQGFSDWHSTAATYPGEAPAISMGYKLTSTGAQQTSTNPYRVFEYEFAVNSGKTVQSITLPGDGNVKVLAINVYAPPALVGAPVINGDNPNGLFTAAGQSANGMQRSMVEDVVYSFSEPVTINDANQAFTVRVAGSMGTAPATLFAQAVSVSNGMQWAVSLTGQADGVLASIANGEYSIAINPAFILAAGDATTAMTTGRTDRFYRLFGDAQGTESVNTLDYARFKQALSTYNPIFDADGNGSVSTLDYARFKQDMSVSYGGDGFVTTI